MDKGRLPRLTAGLAALLSTGGIAAGYQIAAAPAASAVVTPTPVDYTWSGLGGNGIDPSWNNSGNWVGGNKPSTTVPAGTLTFPDLGTCDTSVNTCTYSVDDLGGNVTANAIVFNTATDSYSIVHNTTEGINLGTGGVTLNGPGPTSQGQVESLGIPLTLLASQNWTVDNGTLFPQGGISGTTGSVTLGVTVSHGGVLDVSGAPAELGDVTVSGGDPTQTGGSGAANNGALTLNQGELNDTSGSAVNVNDIQVNGPGQVGSLTSQGSQIYVGNSNLVSAGPGTLSATSVVLDGKTETDFTVVGNNDLGGTYFTQLASSGSVALGGAQLHITPVYQDQAGKTACLTPQPGRGWSLVTGTAITGQFSDQGVSIPDGGIIQMDDCNGNAGQGSHVRINYTQTAVTATPLDTTTTTLTAAPASPQTGQSTVLTATVSSQTSLHGTVSFLDQDGSHPIPGCQNVATINSSHTATCTTSWTEPGENGLGAEFTPSSTSNVTSSSAAIPFTVRVPGATSTQSGMTGDATTPAGATDGNVTATASGGTGTVVVSQYGSDPAAAPTFSSTGKYFDVRLNSGSTFTSVKVDVSGMPIGGGLYWWNAEASKWQAVAGDPGPVPVSGSPGTDEVTFTAKSSPNLTQLTGTIFGISNASASEQPAGPGYRMVASDGGVFDFNQTFYGSTGGVKLTQPIVGTANASSGKGYYLVAKDGGVFAFGPGAKFQGSTGGVKLTQPVVDMSVDTLTGGYRLVAADGGIFSFNAPFKGSTGGVKLVQPIVGMSTDPVTGGYWLVASDGGIFAFDAPFFGSTGGVKLVQPIVGMSAG